MRGLLLDADAREHLAHEYHTHKSCALRCTVSCVRQVAMLDNWRSPQTRPALVPIESLLHPAKADPAGARVTVAPDPCAGTTPSSLLDCVRVADHTGISRRKSALVVRRPCVRIAGGKGCSQRLISLRSCDRHCDATSRTVKEMRFT